MVAAHTLPHPPTIRQISKHGVLILHGFGIKMCVDRGHLCAEWGVGLERYQAQFSRVDGHKLRRVVLLGTDGYISLEALRFISDVGATFSMIDKRGKALMICGPVAPSDARLRRAQSTALSNGTALRISKELIAQKLDGQATLVREMLHDDAADAIVRFRDELPAAQSIEAVRIIEAQAAKLYWQSWADVPVRWSRKDERRIPANWTVFSSRVSPLTHSPRLAANPPNAILNLLYTLLESESRIAAVAMGMLPDVGLLHVDTPSRDSLACDLMEVVRPKVDAFVLNWFQREPLRKADFWEDRNGNCRLTSSLAIKLCETADTWRKLVAPVAEYVAQELWNSVPRASSTRASSTRAIATRLTQQHKRYVKGSDVPAVIIPKPEHRCQDCGIQIRRCNTERCAKCTKPITKLHFKIGRKNAQRLENILKRSDTMHKHRLSIQEWNPANLPSWLTREAYLTRIVPALANVSKSTIRKALGVSEPYSIFIQNGTRIPHVRFWQRLAELAGIIS